MAKRKTIFPCGHKGYGKACHRCPQELAAQQHCVQLLAEKKTKKQEREALFARDIIDLRGLPHHVVTKARAIIAALGENKNYREFGGKRLRHNRSIVSIPVTRNYRMLCEDGGTFLIPQKILSHEDYNVCKPGS
jgi:putative NADH-flavin reductase